MHLLQGFIDVTYMSTKPDGIRLSRGNKVVTRGLALEPAPD